MADNGLVSSFLAAIQASLSVLLVIFYGGIAAHLKLLDSSSGKAISKICVKMFLPALLLTKIGSELHTGSAHRYLLILLWAFICHFVSFLIGLFAHLVFGMPDWITAAIMFNNTTSYPLLLIQSLDETGILSSLVVAEGESTHDAIERAKSYFLVFSTVSSCLTFAVGPRLIDSEHAPEPDDDKEEEDDEADEENGNDNGDQDEAGAGEETHLLEIPSSINRRASVVSVSFFPSKPREHPTRNLDPVIFNRRPSVISRKRWHKLGDAGKWWLLFLYDFLNAPLIGAVLGAIIGLVPALHRAFFADTPDGGIFSAWLTASWKNVGMIFVPLPVIVAGVSLYTAMREAKNHPEAGTPWLTTAFILVVRFALWPVLSIGIIYLLASRTNFLGSDPMLWFTLMLMPTGPSAMKLITMIQVSDADAAAEHSVSKLLTVRISSAI